MTYLTSFLYFSPPPLELYHSYYTLIYFSRQNFSLLFMPAQELCVV